MSWDLHTLTGPPLMDSPFTSQCRDWDCAAGCADRRLSGVQRTSKAPPSCFDKNSIRRKRGEHPVTNWPGWGTCRQRNTLVIYRALITSTVLMRKPAALPCRNWRVQTLPISFTQELFNDTGSLTLTVVSSDEKWCLFSRDGSIRSVQQIAVHAMLYL